MSSSSLLDFESCSNRILYYGALAFRPARATISPQGDVPVFDPAMLKKSAATKQGLMVVSAFCCY